MLRNLRKELAKEFVRYGLMLPPDCRLPGSWHMSEGGFPVSPLPDVDTEDMEDPILDRWNRLSEKLKFDPGYAPPNPAWLGILEAKRIEH